MGYLQENTTSLELGLENKFFNNKLGLDLTFYDATTGKNEFYFWSIVNLEFG